MIIKGIQETEIFEEQFPFRLIINQNIDFTYPDHWHNAIEMLYVTENKFKAYVNSKEYNLNERDILFIPAGNIHEFHSVTPSGTRIFINYDITNIINYADSNWLYNYLCEVKKITPENGDFHRLVEKEILKLMDECNTRTYSYRLFVTARILDILVLICRNATSKININNMEINKKKISGLKKISKSFEYIENNYCDDIKLEDIAKSTGFSECYFSRLFKEVTEKSFHQYLTEYRIRKAEILINDSNHSISSAAHAAGFSNIATFNRLFKQIKGCTPLEYRNLKLPI